MKKIVAWMITLLIMAVAAGCGSPEKDDGKTDQDAFGGIEISENDSELNRISEDDPAYEDDDDYDDYNDELTDALAYDNELADDFDFDAWLQEYTDLYSSAGDGYQSFRNVWRDCNSDINLAVSRLIDLYDTDFFNSDAAIYQQYTGYGGLLFPGVEDIFSGDNEDIESAIKSQFYAEDIAWEVDGGKAVITFETYDQNVTVTVEYDGSSTANAIYMAGGEITQTSSFIKNENYTIVVGTYASMTVIDAVYANGDVYYIYDPSGMSVDFSVYQGSFDDPADLIGDRPYYAICNGEFVY